MRPIEISKRENKDGCWWCGSAELTREHKFKRTDLERLYGTPIEFKRLGVSLIDYRSNNSPKTLQSPKSDYAKFEKSLCSECNTSNSQRFDLAYDRMIEYYLQNEQLIKSNGRIDFLDVYGENWENEKENLFRYIMKHIGCRLAECGLMPFPSTIDYLNGAKLHAHLKIVLQIKPYIILDMPTLYKGPFIPVSHYINKEKITAVCGWFTVKNFTFNYIYQWNVLSTAFKLSNLTPIEVVDYSSFIKEAPYNKSVNSTADFGQIIETFEFFPFTAQRDELEIYNYFLHKNIC